MTFSKVHFSFFLLLTHVLLALFKVIRAPVGARPRDPGLADRNTVDPLCIVLGLAVAHGRIVARAVHGREQLDVAIAADKDGEGLSVLDAEARSRVLVVLAEAPLLDLVVVHPGAGPASAEEAQADKNSRRDFIVEERVLL